MRYIGILALCGIILAGCATAQPTPRSAPSPTLYWYWAGAGPHTSAQQFNQDKYACLQDYRNSQSLMPVRRDALTELQFMNLHQHICLESHGLQQKEETPRKSI